MFTWAEGTTEAQQREVETRLAALPAEIPELVAYCFGRDAGLGEGNHDFAVVADFETREGFIAYTEHPSHRAVLEEVIRPILAHRAAVQFETADRHKETETYGQDRSHRETDSAAGKA